MSSLMAARGLNPETLEECLERLNGNCYFSSMVLAAYDNILGPSIVKVWSNKLVNPESSTRYPSELFNSVLLIHLNILSVSDLSWNYIFISRVLSFIPYHSWSALFYQCLGNSFVKFDQLYFTGTFHQYNLPTDWKILCSLGDCN